MRRLRILDVLALLVALLTIGGFSAFAYSGRGGTPMVDVQGSAGRWIYPLNADRTIKVRGPLGETLITIKDHSVRFIESPCPDQLCVRAQAISKIGEWNACLPNKVFVRIEGQHAETIDALAF